MTGKFENIQICGISAAVPSKIEENAKAAEILGERRCRKQIKLTGVKSRHVSAEEQVLSDLCYPAAKKLMEHLKWQPDEIKVLVLLTQCENYRTPSTAFLIQKLLGIPQDCIVFDMNLGCSAFNAGIQVVASLLQQFPGNIKALCFQGDLAYESIHHDMSADAVASNMLFGSAASVVAIEKMEQRCGFAIPIDTLSDGKRYRAILRHYNDSLNMDGEAVFAFSIGDVADSIIDFRKKNRIFEPDIDFYVFHQAQKLILDNIAVICEIPEGKELRSLEEYGNTSGASIPLSLCVNGSRYADKDKIRILSCGFGVGLTWSTSYIEIETKNILPVLVSDVLYEK